MVLAFQKYKNYLFKEILDWIDIDDDLKERCVI
jgi:hypothetical protein